MLHNLRSVDLSALIGAPKSVASPGAIVGTGVIALHSEHQITGTRRKIPGPGGIDVHSGTSSSLATCCRCFLGQRVFRQALSAVYKKNTRRDNEPFNPSTSPAGSRNNVACGVGSGKRCDCRVPHRRPDFDQDLRTARAPSTSHAGFVVACGDRP